LLDPEAFLAAVQACAGEDADLATARISYIRYKPRTSCLVAYQLDAAGSVMDVYARAHRTDALDKLRTARERASVSGSLGFGSVVLEDRALVVSAFPNDRRLGALRRLEDKESRDRLFQRLVPHRPDLWAGTVRRIAYKPERRYVAQLVVGEQAPALLKIYTGDDYPRALANATAFKSSGPLRLAESLGHSNRRHVLAQQWLSGRSVNDALSDPHLDLQTLTVVGAALAALHAQDAKALTRLTPDVLATILGEVAAAVGSICPQLEKRAHDLARRLAARLVDEPQADRPIHGDFYARQVLVGGDTAAILDLDEAALGNPAIDLGNFVAHLERDALRGDLSPGRVESLKDAFIDGYRVASRNSIRRTIQLYAAVGLLRLAPQAFRYDRQPNWREQTEAIVERTEALMEEASRQAFPNVAQKRRPVPTQADVVDPFGVVSDQKMPFLAQVINPIEAQRQLACCLSYSTGDTPRVHLRGIRVTRHKPGRRCLIEYDLEMEQSDASAELVTLVGKARARGPDASTYRLLKSLWETAFSTTSEDGISVPEPIGVIPSFHMWLQRKVPGTAATRLLAEPGGNALASRIAEVAHKLHQVGTRPPGSHSMVDELRILHERLAIVAQLKPEWRNRLERLLDSCDRLGAATPEPRHRGIHRDFYADHVIVDGPRLYVLDVDLFCQGDPGLDIGNFLGHLTEWCLRTLGDPHALADREAALEERFVDLSGPATRAAVRTYTVLTLVRHIYLSTQFPERRPFTEALLELCEQELGVTRFVH
jgi:aminoglycoside phosphotransferase (APT) family kinase protein